MPDDRPLTGRAILLREPDPFVAGYIRTALTSCGAEVFSPAGDRHQCLAWLEGAAIHAAVLNPGDPISLVAAVRGRGIALVLVCDAGAEIDEAHEGPCLRKPFASFQLVEALVALLGPGAARSGG